MCGDCDGLWSVLLSQLSGQVEVVEVDMCGCARVCGCLCVCLCVIAATV